MKQEHNKIRNIVRKCLFESLEQYHNLARPQYVASNFNENNVDGDLEEERIANSQAIENIKTKTNFLSSHMAGEDLGDLGKMYVTWSFDDLAYIYFAGKWYKNSSTVLDKEGNVSIPHLRHMTQMKPTNETHALSNDFMKTMVHRFMKKHNIKSINHELVPSGEK